MWINCTGILNFILHATCTVIGHCPWPIRVQIHDTSKETCFLCLFNMARGFENVCEIILDFKASESLKYSLAGAIYKEEK